MGLSVTDIDEDLVRRYLKDSKDKEVLDRLLKHLSIVKRFGSMDAHHLAGLFAPSFLGGSYGQEKAVKFLEKIINSFGLLSSPPPERLNDTNKSITETSMNQEMMLASSSKLKESSVYQDFIMNTSNRSKEIKLNVNDTKMDDFDDNDEIDALVAPVNKSNVSSGNLKMLNVGSQQPSYLGGSMLNKSPRTGIKVFLLITKRFHIRMAFLAA
jgi:hypothetical protein